MASITIRNLPAALITRIKKVARSAGRSMEQELRLLLQERFPAESPEPGPTKAAPGPRCPRCGSDALASGGIQSTGKVYFRPANAKFLTLKTADILVRARMCLACGGVELIADVDKARALTRPDEGVGHGR